MEHTLDPRSLGSGVIDRDALTMNAVTVVLFHPDLRRVGEVHVLGPAHTAARAETIIGRDQPVFVAASGHGRPLADPCISRHQLSIRYLGPSAGFAVLAAPDARRPLSLWTMAGTPLAGDGAALPADALVAIGDRILLWVGLLPDDGGSDPVTADDLGIIGTSPACRALRRQIRALAGESATVLVRGETGTGKELVARALHTAGPRASEPFVAVNCAAIAEDLIDSELFGHARGAFSGALHAHEGLFRAARGGTLFLDEIGELSPMAQAKLLRVLQERTVRPVGDAHEHAISARVIAATHRALDVAAGAGRFRPDLLARIEAPAIDVAPLRERALDVPLLFVHFLERAARASGSAAALFREAAAAPPRLPMTYLLDLLARAWPRNVRELEKHAVVAELGFRTNGRWPAPPNPARATAPPTPGPAEVTGEVAAVPAPPRTRARPSAEELARCLDERDGIARRVAEDLGVSRTTLDKWMRELGIRRPTDVGIDEIRAALGTHGDDLVRAAAALRISARGLKLRLRELRLLPS